jgi:hypothetical protein
MNTSDKETRWFPAKKVDGGLIVRLSHHGICIKLLTLRGRPDYACYTYKPFTGRLGIAERVRAWRRKFRRRRRRTKRTSRICNEVASFKSTPRGWS